MFEILTQGRIQKPELNIRCYWFVHYEIALAQKGNVETVSLI